MGTSVVYIAEYDILEGNADLQGAKRSRLHDDITATPVRLFFILSLSSSKFLQSLAVMLEKHQSELIEHTMAVGALKFGSFTLKSGRYRSRQYLKSDPHLR